MYKRSGWANNGKQARKHHSSMVFASISVSRFLPGIPVLASLSNECKLNEPFPSQIDFVNITETYTGFCLRSGLLSLHMVGTQQICWRLFGFIFNSINLTSLISVTITSTFILIYVFITWIILLTFYFPIRRLGYNIFQVFITSECLLLLLYWNNKLVDVEFSGHKLFPVKHSVDILCCPLAFTYAERESRVQPKFYLS